MEIVKQEVTLIDKIIPILTKGCIETYGYLGLKPLDILFKGETESYWYFTTQVQEGVPLDLRIDKNTLALDEKPLKANFLWHRVGDLPYIKTKVAVEAMNLIFRDK